MTFSQESVGGRRWDACNGKDLKEMFTVGMLCLERSAEAINSLNVFPVPDGDTGTNMLLTMRATVEEAYRCSEESAAAVAQASGADRR